MFQIKKILNDLIDHTYKDSEKLEDYKRFYVEMSKKDLKSKHGDYCTKTHHIWIFNLYRSNAAITTTTIHELAHHIDFMNRGKTDHGLEFYTEYKKLLYRGLDMHLFSKEEFLSATRDASDSNKVAKMIKEYEPADIGYKSDCRIIAVSGCYLQREQLKEAGYGWNKINRTWEKEITEAEMEKENEFLKGIGLMGQTKDAGAIAMNRKNHIIAGKGAHDFREELKKVGFYFTDAKKWMKQGDIEELEILRKKFPRVEFKLSSYRGIYAQKIKGKAEIEEGKRMGCAKLEGMNLWRSYKQELEQKIEEIEKSKMPHKQRVASKIVTYENYNNIFRKNSPIKNAAFTDYQELQPEERWEFDEEDICFNQFLKELGEKVKKLKDVLFYLTMEELGWNEKVNLESYTCTWEKQMKEIIEEQNQEETCKEEDCEEEEEYKIGRHAKRMR